MVSKVYSRGSDSSQELRSSPRFSIMLLLLLYFLIQLLCLWSHPRWNQNWKPSSNKEIFGSPGFSSMKCSSNGMQSVSANTSPIQWIFSMVVSSGSPFLRLFSKHCLQVLPTCQLSGRLGCLELSECLELQDCWELSSPCKPSCRSSPDHTSLSFILLCWCSFSSSFSHFWEWVCSVVHSTSSKENREVIMTLSRLHSLLFSRYSQWKTGKVCFSTQWDHPWIRTPLVFSTLCGSS